MEILGVKIDNLSIEEVFARINGFLESDKQHYIVTPNPEFLVWAREDEEFKEILNKADLAVPDGVGLVFASWFLGKPLKKRIAGADLMDKICQDAAKKRWQILLTGGGEGVAQKTAEALKKNYQGLLVKEIDILDFNRYTTKRSSILFVALGAPKQEKWIVENLSKLPSVKLAVGVGGAFDVISGDVRRAPKFLRAAGLEWAWRLGIQPWRASRIFNAIARFPWMVISAKVRTGRR